MFSKNLSTSILQLCSSRDLSYEEAAERCDLSPRYFGSMPDPYFNVYGPSKAFDYFLSAAMYGELQDSEVTVSTLLSGPIKTNWAKNAGKADSGMARDPRDIAM